MRKRIAGGFTAAAVIASIIAYIKLGRKEQQKENVK